MIHKTRVIKGHGRGKKLLGYPTLNLIIPSELLTEHGIYAGWVIFEGRTYPGAFHYGPIPSFNDAQPSLEVFVIDHNIKITPTVIFFEFTQKIREIKNFTNLEQLIQQIKQDVKKTKSVLRTTISPEFKI